jgi:transcriptional regulator with GAF, ATPase, and Fis domain
VRRNAILGDALVMRTIKVEASVIAVTNRKLVQVVNEGKFRKIYFYS